MKKILILLALFMCVYNTYSQNEIIPLVYDISIESYDDGYRNGQYYKDTYNHLNVFEGTWVFQNGNTTFKLVLEKKEQ